MNYLIETILTRRSCRNFLNKAVNESEIMQIIECGLSAPSGMNEQPWYIVAVKNKKLIDSFSENIKSNFLKSSDSWRQKWASQKNFHAFYNAPIVFMIFGKSTTWAKVDCAIVTQNMTLACESLDMASCIIGEVTWIDKELISKSIKIPKNYEITLGLSVGFAKKPKKSKRKVNEKKFLVMD